MARHTEPLNGGLVTNRDPALLSEGQLSDLRNAVYKPASQALQRAAGRTAFGTASATGVDVVGLRDVHFDNDVHLLVAHASSSYLTATVGDTGTFGVLSSAVGVGNQLDRIHFRNRFYLLNGVSSNQQEPSSNRTIYLSATAAGTNPNIRNHGLLPVQAPPTVTTAAGAFSQDSIVSGYYEYWTTEIASSLQDGSTVNLESTYSSDNGVTTVFVASTAVVPIIEQPAPRNVGFTGWRIYRSPLKTSASETKFPTGFMIADLSASTTSQADTLTVASASALPASFNAASEPLSDFTTPSGLSAVGGASASVNLLGGDPGLFVKQQGTYGYNLGGFKGAVKGITIELSGHVSSGGAPVTVYVGIGKRTTSGFFQDPFGKLHSFSLAQKSGTITSTSAATPTILTLGSPTDRWFASDNVGFSDGDFTSLGMMVVIAPSISTGSKTVQFDYIKLTVHYGGTIDSTVPFPTVVYTLGDTIIQVGKNGVPPSSSTGDMFEDSLVLNDVANPSIVRWSYPGDPEAFPAPFFVDIETEDNDRVTCIKTVNERCMVGTLNGVARLNYLPSELDASFTPGKAKSWITRKFGIANEMCACVYSPDGGSERLAFVSLKGIHDTDGFDFRTLTDLDWRQIVATANSEAIALINDPENSELLFYYKNGTSGENYKCLHLSYDKDHQVESGLKSSGLVNMRNWNIAASASAKIDSAWSVPRSNGDTSIYLGYGGTATAAGAGAVYIEGGSTIPAEDPSMSYTTRRLYLNGFGSEWRLNELYEYGTIEGTQITTYTAKNLKTNDASGEVTVESKTMTLSGQRLYKTQFRQQAEGLRMTMAVVSGHDDRSCDFLIFDGDDFGVEKSGL